MPSAGELAQSRSEERKNSTGVMPVDGSNQQRAQIAKEKEQAHKDNGQGQGEIARQPPAVSRRVIYFITVTILFVLDIFAIFAPHSEHQTDLEEYGKIFYAALKGVDPWHVFECQYLYYFGSDAMSRLAASESCYGDVSLLGVVLAAVSFVLFGVIWGLLGEKWSLDTRTVRFFGDQGGAFINLVIIVIGTSVTLWVLQSTLFGFKEVIGWAYGFLAWANGATFGALIIFSHAHSVLKAGRKVGSAGRDLLRP